MEKEQYVSLETSQLLKEKGFDWEVHRSYLVNDNVFIPGDINDVPLRKDAIRIPTLQMAMKWLREVHGIDISIDIRFWTDDEGVDVKSWRYTVYRTDEIEDFGQSDIYEEAAEAAIKYCLENLI